MENSNNLPAPPWDMENAAARLQLLENDYNTLDAHKISRNFTEQAEVRYGSVFLNGREAVKDFIADDLAAKKSYSLHLDLWGALKGRMAVRYEMNWTDAAGKSFRAYGVQVFQFNEDSLIEMNFSSFNEQEIKV